MYSRFSHLLFHLLVGTVLDDIRQQANNVIVVEGGTHNTQHFSFPH